MLDRELLVGPGKKTKPNKEGGSEEWGGEGGGMVDRNSQNSVYSHVYTIPNHKITKKTDISKQHSKQAETGRS